MKRIVALVIMLALLLPSAAALAASKTTVYAAKLQVQVYAAKSTAAKKIGKLSYGESVVCSNYKEFATGWAKIQNSSGKIGYCKMDLLTNENVNDLGVSLKASGDGAKVMAKPSDSSRMLARVPKGTNVKAVAITPNCKWFRVKFSSAYGYVRVSSLTSSTKKYYTGRNVTIENENKTVLGEINYGEVARIIKEEGKRVLVRKGGTGIVGWVADGDFSSDDPCDKKDDGFAVADGVALYNKAVAAKANVQKTFSKGDKVIVLGGSKKIGFFRVTTAKTDGSYGYILANCLVDAKPEGNVTAELNADANVYEGKLNKGDPLAKLSKGDKVVLLEVKNARAKVKTAEDVTGWVQLSALDCN